MLIKSPDETDANRRTDVASEVPTSMRAWQLCGPGELEAVSKPVPRPGNAEVLVRIDAVAICATDLDVIQNGAPAMVEGGEPFNKGWTPGHEYMGTIAALGANVDEWQVGDRVAVEIHNGCGRCKRCRAGMYTSCTNYGANYPGNDKGHRANGFTTQGGFAEYAVNHVNTLVRVPHGMSNAEAALAVTAGTSMYGFTELGGLIAGESVVVVGPGPIGLLAVAVAKALGASPVVLAGTRENRNAIGRKLGADHTFNVKEVDIVAEVKALTGGLGADYVMECAGTEQSLNDSIHMTSRGGKICLAAFPHQPAPIDLAHAVMNNIYLFGIRGEGKSAVARAMALMAAKRFDATLVHTHTFGLNDLPEAIRYAKDRVDDAIKVVVEPGLDAASE